MAKLAALVPSARTNLMGPPRYDFMENWHRTPNGTKVDAYSQFRESGIGRIEFPLANRMYKREVDNALQKPVNMAFVVFDAMQNDSDKDRLSNTYESITTMKRPDTTDTISSSLPAYGDLLTIDRRFER